MIWVVLQKLPKNVSRASGDLLTTIAGVKNDVNDSTSLNAPALAAALKIVNSVTSSPAIIPGPVATGKRSPTTATVVAPPSALVRDLTAHQASLINSLPAARFLDSVTSKSGSSVVDDVFAKVAAATARPKSAQSNYSDDSERPLEIVDNSGQGASDNGGDLSDDNESSFDSGPSRPSAFPGTTMDYEDSAGAAAFLENAFAARRKAGGAGARGDHGPINLSLSSGLTVGVPGSKQPLTQLSSMALAAQALQGAFTGLANSSDAGEHPCFLLLHSR